MSSVCAAPLQAPEKDVQALSADQMWDIIRCTPSRHLMSIPAFILSIPAFILSIPAFILSIPAFIMSVPAFILSVPAFILSIPTFILPVPAFIPSVHCMRGDRPSGRTAGLFIWWITCTGRTGGCLEHG